MKRLFFYTLALFILGVLFKPMTARALSCQCIISAAGAGAILPSLLQTTKCLTPPPATTIKNCDELETQVKQNPGGFLGSLGSAVLNAFSDISCDEQFVDNNCQLKEEQSVTEILEDLKIKKPLLEITIPGVTFSDVANTVDPEGNIHLPWIGELIGGIYRFGLATISIVAVVMIIIQGIRIVTSGGGEQKMTGYKKIGQIVIGLFLAWGSYAILYTINPDLVQFKILKVKFIEPIEISTENSGEVITPEDIAAPREGSNSVPLFKQGEFANVRYGICGTVKSSGCGPSSMAMVMKYYGANVDPALVATTFAQEGYRACPDDGDCSKCNGTKWTAFTKSKLLSEFNLVGEQITDRKKLVEILQQKKPVIAAVDSHAKGITTKGTIEPFTRGGHFIVLTGLNEKGEILVNDPAKAITITTFNLLIPSPRQGLKGMWYVRTK